MKSRPPAYLKFVPAIFIIACAFVAYVATEFASENIDTIKASGPFSEFTEAIGDAKEVVDEIKSVIKEFQKLTDWEKKEKRKAGKERAKASKGMKRPTLDELSKTPRVIVEFNEESHLFDLSLMQSKGYKGSFAVDKSQLDKTGNFPALLKANNMGGAGNTGYVTGVISFRKPVEIGKMQAIEITVKGAGIKSFGFSILKSDQNNWIGWGIQKVKAPKEWKTITRPLVDFDYWSYDMKKRRYNRGVEWVYPKKINSIRFYIQLHHLNDKKSGSLKVSKVALR